MHLKKKWTRPNLITLFRFIDTTIGFSDSKLDKFWVDHNWCTSNKHYSIRQSSYLQWIKFLTSFIKIEILGYQAFRQRSSGESPIKRKARRRLIVHTNTGWTERATHKSRLCLERRSDKRTRSSETAVESVRHERAGCGWCCLSDRWDLSIQMASWELQPRAF